MPRVQTLLPLRLLILAWLITWITSVPFYHVHLPDTTDRWSVLHSGGAHTVLTPDLPGEFSRPFQERQKAHSAHLLPRSVNSPERGIALLDEKSTANELNSLGTASHVLENPLLHSVGFAFPEEHSTHRLSSACLASRAPPRTICV